jgi:hypothetical protein
MGISSSMLLHAFLGGGKAAPTSRIKEEAGHKGLKALLCRFVFRSVTLSRAKPGTPESEIAAAQFSRRNRVLWL